jgi:hypothetical protein
MHSIRILVLTAAIVTIALPAGATSYVMMRDRALADDAPVIADVSVASIAQRYGRRPVTDYTVDVVELLKGSAPDRLVVRVLGGERGDGTMLQIFGAPRFTKGERAVLFLEPDQDGTYRIEQFLLGAFHEVTVNGEQLAVRDLSEARSFGGLVVAPTNLTPRFREAGRFKQWLRDRAVGDMHPGAYLKSVDRDAMHFAIAPFTLFHNNGLAFRWFNFDTGGSVVWKANATGQSGMSGGGFAQFHNALAAWTNSGMRINLTDGGTTTASGGFAVRDGTNAIVWDDPNNEISGAFSCAQGGVLAIGGISNTSGSGTFNGATYWRASEGDIVTQNGAGCFFAGNSGKNGEEVFTHELGHTLGLDHSCGDANTGACDTTQKDDAIMRAVAHGDGRGARLGSDDLAGVQSLYGLRTTFTKKPYDFGYDGRSDVLWRHTTDGRINIWQMNGTAVQSKTVIATLPSLQPVPIAAGDFDGDGKADIVLQDTNTAAVTVWLMNGATIASQAQAGAMPDLHWKFSGVGDFDGDGKADLLWRHDTTGEVDITFMNGTSITARTQVATVANLNNKIAGVGDFDGDGKADILWRDDVVTGDVTLWKMNGATVTSQTLVQNLNVLPWQVVGTGDYNGDGKADIFWRHSTDGRVSLWLMNGAVPLQKVSLGSVPDLNWKVIGSGDYDGDGKSDLFWHNPNDGRVSLWIMNGVTVVSKTTLATIPDTRWRGVYKP